MSREIEMRLRALMVKHFGGGFAPDDVQLTTSLVDDLTVASFDRCDLVDAMNAEFHTAMTNADLHSSETVQDVLDLVMAALKPVTREQQIERARKLRADIEQIFTDVDHWNRAVRKTDEEPIDADPDGKIRQLASGLDRMLHAEQVRAGVLTPTELRRRQGDA